MRLTKWFALLALVASALTLPSPAAAEGWFSDLDKAKSVTLGELVRDPNAFVDVPVKVKVYFDTTASNYNPFYTRFSNNVYFNFAAWPINARLYDRRDFRRSYPFFFVQKVGRKWNKTASIKRVTAVELTCVVRDVFRGQPWIEVMDYDTIRTGLTVDDVKNVVAGDAYMMAGRYKEAVERYAEVARTRLPDNVRVEVYRKLADAQFHVGNYSKAEDAYEDALDVAPKSKVLKQGLAAARDMKERARWESVAKKRAHIKVAPAPFHVPAVSHRTDVDDIIAATEDPEKVRRETEAHRLATEQRVGYRRPVAVSGKPADKAQAKEAAVADGEVVVKDGKVDGEEGCGTESAEEGDEPVVRKGEVVEDAVESGEKAEEVVEEKAEENSDGCGDTVVEEQPAEEKAEEEAEEVVEEKTEQPADEEVVEEKVVEETAEEVVEEAEEVVEENVVEENADEVVDGCGEEPAEEKAPVVVPVPVEGDGNQGGSEPVETAEEPEDEMTETVVLVKDNELRDGEVLVVNGEPQVVEKQAAVVEEQDDVVEGNEGAEVDENAEEQPVEEAEVDDQAEADEGCGEEPAGDDDGATVMVEDGKVVVKDNAAVVAGPQPAVANTLPRLPFFGCEAVTAADLRVIIESIAKNPEQF